MTVGPITGRRGFERFERPGDCIGERLGGLFEPVRAAVYFARCRFPLRPVRGGVALGLFELGNRGVERLQSAFERGYAVHASPASGFELVERVIIGPFARGFPGGLPGGCGACLGVDEALREPRALSAFLINHAGPPEKCH